MRKLFLDVQWLVLNGNWIAILETKGDIYIYKLSAFFPYIMLDDLDSLTHPVQVQVRAPFSPRKTAFKSVNYQFIVDGIC